MKPVRPATGRRFAARTSALACLLAAFAFGLASATPPSAEDYYHAASYQYVAGKLQEASVEAEEGLRLYPHDAKLQMLADHLRQMKDQQRGDRGDGADEDDQGDRDKEQDQQGRNPDDRKNPDDRDREDDSEEGDNGNNDADQEQGDAPHENNRNENRGGSRDGNAAQAPAMSEAEAERLLNSFADDEKKEQAERRKVIRSRAGTEQDW